LVQSRNRTLRPSSAVRSTARRMVRWIVVGGGAQGGIMVRQGKDLKSPAEKERLATGAVIEQLELESQRLQYKLITGSGPAEGWVSPKLKEKDLVLLESEWKKFPKMYFGTTVPKQTYKEFADDYFKRLEAGEIVGPVETYPERLTQGLVRAGATGRPPIEEGGIVDADFETRRRVVGENLDKVKAELAKYKKPPPYQRMTKPQLEKECPKMLPGDSYGVDIPPNLDALERLGANWLTKAFRAAGTIPEDNMVKRIVKFKRLPMTTKDAAGGAGAKAFLTVEYEKPDPQLHTELFVKLPWDTVGTKETGGDALWRYKISGVSDMEYGECTVYHFLGPLFPFKIPKWYFADICRSNTNYILVTEKILFGGSAEYFEGKKKKSFEPYEVLPVAEKYFDFEREPRLRYEMYYAIMRAMARLAAWDHMKKFECIPIDVRGFDRYPKPLLGDFKFPQQMSKKRRELVAKAGETCCKLLRELVCEKGKFCFPQELSKEEFLNALCAAIMDSTKWKDDLFLYQNLFPDKISFLHVNLQSDNAYFWYTDKDEIDCGIIDWGGAGPTPLFHHFSGSLTSCEGEVLLEHEMGFLKCFVDEFYRECGLKIDLAELYRMFLISCLTNVAGYCLNIEMEIFREVPREEWATIRAIEDSRVLGNWNTRCYVYMIRIVLKYLYLHWTKNGSLVHHEALLEWVAYWEARGME